MVTDNFCFSIDENGHAVIKSGVTEIEKCFFPIWSGARDIVSVHIPFTVTDIKDEAFNNLVSLKTIVIPENVTEIGEKAFHKCYNLSSIEVSENNPRFCSADGVLFDKKTKTLFQLPKRKQGECSIPEGVTRISDYTFYYAPGLTRVVIPESVLEIDSFAFSHCENLASIDVNENNPHFCSVDGVLFDKTMKTLYRFPEGKQGEYRIPEGVTSIADYAFYNVHGLTHVVIPNGVLEIGRKAFAYCDKLDRTKIPSSVTSIRSSAFLDVKHIDYHGATDWYRCDFTAVDWTSDYDQSDTFWGAKMMN